MTKNTIIFIILITFLAFIAVKTEAACPFVTIGLSRGYYDEPTQEVFALQRFLARDKNIYPEGLVTGYFGKLTEAALKRFQTKNGLSPTGIVDEKTKEILCNKYVQCPFVTDMKKGDFEEKNEEVKELQKLLKQDKSIYPEGLVTGYFGRLTEAALKRFQERYGISVTGEVNSKTREKLCDIYVYGWKEKISQVTTTTTNINQLPDLLIGDISYIPSYPKVGETVTFKAKVKNIGLQNASSHLFQISRANQTIFSTYLTLNAQETKEVSFFGGFYKGGNYMIASRNGQWAACFYAFCNMEEAKKLATSDNFLDGALILMRRQLRGDVIFPFLICGKIDAVYKDYFKSHMKSLGAKAIVFYKTKRKRFYFMEV